MTRLDSKNGQKKKPDKTQTELHLYQLPGKIFDQEDDFRAEKWFDCAPTWPEQGIGGKRAPVKKWKEIAVQVSASASNIFAKQTNAKTGEAVEKALNREKTISDKVAALTLLVQESPLHRFEELKTLMSFTHKKVRREKTPAIEALTDLFINNLLPSDRRLITFEDLEFKCAKGEISKRHLVYALFESNLKELYLQFVEVLEELSKDTLVHFRKTAVKVISQLLVAKPENEKLLLSLLVNKLGDPERGVSSEAAYMLNQLITKHHPQMRLIVVKEVEQLLTRPNITRKTQYYAVIFLNQIKFTDEDTELARRFVRIYLDLFTTCLAEEEENEREKDSKSKKTVDTKQQRKQKKKGKAKSAPKQAKNDKDAKESRLMGALLTGVNRAFPYTKPGQDDTSYGEHYNALYKVAHAHALSSATNALAFLFQLSQSNAVQSDRYYRAVYCRILDAASVGESKQAAFLSLVYKSMKNDTNEKRLKAFCKRLLQAGAYGSSGFSAACTIVISEVFKGTRFGIIRSFLSLPENFDEDEVFADADTEETQKILNQEDKPLVNNVKKHQTKADELDKLEENDNSTQEKKDRKVLNTYSHYDPRKREPQFAGAEKTCLWEAVILCSHYHPSVSLFGKELCQKLSTVSYGGDPLKDFTEIAFLDKFSYKKPKNRIAKSLYGKRAAQYRNDPLPNSAEFQELAKKGEVQEDDLHFVKFFEANPNRVTKEPEHSIFHDSDIDGSAIDSEEEAFENAMRAEMMRLGADEGLLNDPNGNFPDIDEEDEDELRAFEEAFQNEIVPSDNEDDEEKPDDTRELLSLSTDDDNEEDELGQNMKKSKKRKRSKENNTFGVFADREDFAEAIDAEYAENELHQNAVNIGTAKDSDKNKNVSNEVPLKKKRKKRQRRKTSKP